MLPSIMPDQQDLLVAPAETGVPQFATAEFAHVPGSERCRICGSFLGVEYFRINNQMACTTCAGQARDGQPTDSHAAFARGLALGIGAAIAGMIFYAGFTIVTHFYLGYIALAVGWLVAKAIMMGSKGIGGRRYQIAAVALTYFAISMAAVPIGISVYMRQGKHVAKQAASDGAAPATSGDDAAQPAQQGRPNIAALLGALLLYGLASPFMELASPLHGAIGLFILFIGLRIAWAMTAARPLEVDGPYSVTAG